MHGAPGAQQSLGALQDWPSVEQQVPSFGGGGGGGGSFGARMVPLHAPQHVLDDVLHPVPGGEHAAPSPPSGAPAQQPAPWHSQPSARLPSQSYQLGAHATWQYAGGPGWHVLVSPDDGAMHACPHVPQFAFVLSCVSQPVLGFASQSPHPGSHASLHVPRLHAGVACGALQSRHAG